MQLDKSPIWDKIHKTSFAGEIDLETFRSSAPLYSLTMWNPETNGLRYLKMLLFILLSKSDPADFDLYRKIENRDIGKPVTVKVNGAEVCMDYFQALDEAKTIAQAKLAPTRVIEIAPGYGRTCHALLSLQPQIREYWLIEPGLSKRYLERVLRPEQFAKLRFMSAAEFSKVDETFNLAINVNSLSEMPRDVIDAFLDLIDRTCRAFYCKNPVGRMDPFDIAAINSAIPVYFSAYNPGSKWYVAGHKPTIPWAYYHQAIFRRQ